VRFLFAFSIRSEYISEKVGGRAYAESMTFEKRWQQPQVLELLAEPHSLPSESPYTSVRSEGNVSL
jgi:hypothetical protein